MFNLRIESEQEALSLAEAIVTSVDSKAFLLAMGFVSREDVEVDYDLLRQLGSRLVEARDSAQTMPELCGAEYPGELVAPCGRIKHHPLHDYNTSGETHIGYYTDYRDGEPISRSVRWGLRSEVRPKTEPKDDLPPDMEMGDEWIANHKTEADRLGLTGKCNWCDRTARITEAGAILDHEFPVGTTCDGSGRNIHEGPQTDRDADEEDEDQDLQVECPECKKLILVDLEGKFLRHAKAPGQTCGGSYKTLGKINEMRAGF